MPESFSRHLVRTLQLAVPLAAAQLAQMGMGVTDTLMLGTLGPEALAAGGLGAATFFTAILALGGVLGAVGVLVATAVGAGERGRVPALLGTGLLLALVLAGGLVLLLGQAERLLLLAGEPPALSAEAGRFLRVLRWGAPGGLVGLGLMRAVLPALGLGRRLLPVTLGGVGLNAVLSWGLMHGRWGLPALGLTGSAWGSATTLSAVALALLAPCLRAGSVLPPPARPRGRDLSRILALGLPIGATVGLETTLFLATGLVMGRMGAAPLAAHQVALSAASVCFTLPLGLAQAANVRVATARGARQPREARRAGLAAIALGLLVMAATATALLVWRHPLAALYLPPGSDAARPIAVRLLGLAALFQLADGTQAVAAGALRGLQDARAPMLLALLGYWGVGFPLGLWLQGPMGPGGPWLGLAAGLAVVAGLLVLRFVRLSGRPAPAEG